MRRRHVSDSEAADMTASVGPAAPVPEWDLPCFFLLCVHLNRKSDLLNASVNQQNHLSIFRAAGRRKYV